MSDEEALILGMCAAPDDDLPRLVYADWVDEHSRDTALWRQWIELRRSIRGELEGHTGVDDTMRISETLNSVTSWLQRCYAADVGRLVGERWPIKWDEIQHKDAFKWKSTIEHTRLIAELYACGLVNDAQLKKAYSATHSAANSTDSAAYWAARSSAMAASSSAMAAISASYYGAAYWAATARSAAYSLANRYAELVETFARTFSKESTR